MNNFDTNGKKAALKKALLIQPDLQVHGGGNTVAVWMIEALKSDYDLSVMTWMPFELNALNRNYGTGFKKAEFKALHVPLLFRFLVFILPGFHEIRKLSILIRWCKIVRKRYDVILTAYNELDFGKKGIQYVHYPHRVLKRFREQCLDTRQAGIWRWLNDLKSGNQPWCGLLDFSAERMLENRTLVNSNWTGEKFRGFYRSPALTVYPPVPGEFPEAPWDEKENGFVCIGRISGEKRLEEVIDILAHVRPHVPDIHLHIIGSKVSYNEGYYQRVKKKVAEHAAWVFLEENPSRNELIELVCKHRYGIHGTKDEHFGIAVAEMIRAGCIPFVPDSGGQVEIVGREPRLLYGSDAEAVEKILDVLKHPKEQQALLKHLASRGDLFSTEKFMHQIREVVAEFLQNKQ